jgi:hypothetical protein
MGGVSGSRVSAVSAVSGPPSFDYGVAHRGNYHVICNVIFPEGSGVEPPCFGAPRGREVTKVTKISIISIRFFVRDKGRGSRGSGTVTVCELAGEIRLRARLRRDRRLRHY